MLVWLALTWVAVADTLTLFVAVAPLALVCAARVALGVLRNSESLRERWYDLALLAAAILAIPTELAATAVIRALGGWQVNGLSTALATAGELAGNARLTGEGLLELFGANVFGAAATGSALAVTFAIVHLVGVALAAAWVIGAATSAAHLMCTACSITISLSPVRRTPPRARSHHGGGPAGSGRCPRRLLHRSSGRRGTPSTPTSGRCRASAGTRSTARSFRRDRRRSRSWTPVSTLRIQISRVWSYRERTSSPARVTAGQRMVASRRLRIRGRSHSRQ